MRLFHYHCICLYVVWHFSKNIIIIIDGFECVDVTLVTIYWQEILLRTTYGWCFTHTRNTILYRVYLLRIMRSQLLYLQRLAFGDELQ